MSIKRNTTICIVIAVGLIIAIILLQKPVTSLLSKNHLLPEPETFTELYFEDHANLPKTIQTDKKYVFFFTVHNLEHKEMKYPYEVAIVDGEKRKVIDHGEFGLKHDAYKTTDVQFTIAETAARVKIETCLTELKQCVHFWME